MFLSVSFMGSSYHFKCVHASDLSIFRLSYLLLLLLHSLEVGFEVHRLFDLWPQQSSQHCVGRHPYSLQVRSLHFALQLKDLLWEVLNLLFPGQHNKQPSECLQTDVLITEIRASSYICVNQDVWGHLETNIWGHQSREIQTNAR